MKTKILEFDVGGGNCSMVSRPNFDLCISALYAYIHSILYMPYVQFIYIYKTITLKND